MIKVKYQKCLEPNETCNAKPIRAHSIQNSKVLEFLTNYGHVIMPSLRHDSNGRPYIVFNRIGRNQATTFSGLCSKHDTEIFKPIEKSDVVVSNPEQAFLLAYRSVIKEAHACIETACKLQCGYIQRVKSGLSQKGIPDRAGCQAVDFWFNAVDMHLYKRKYDEAYISKDFSRVSHVTILFDKVLPSLAASALFSLDDIDWPEDVARLALNIFPCKGKVIVLFSFLKEEKSYVYQYIQRIIHSSGYYQKYLISKIILQHCQNLVLSPKFYNQMTNEQKKAVEEFFIETIWLNKHGFENKHLYLFWDNNRNMNNQFVNAES